MTPAELEEMRDRLRQARCPRCGARPGACEECPGLSEIELGVIFTTAMVLLAEVDRLRALAEGWVRAADSMWGRVTERADGEHATLRRCAAEVLGG